MKKILLIIAVLFLSIGCSKKTKQKLGLTETMPDEYQVQRNKSLEVPPHYRAQSTKAENNTPVKKELSKSEKALLKEIE